MFSSFVLELYVNEFCFCCGVHVSLLLCKIYAEGLFKIIQFFVFFYDNCYSLNLISDPRRMSTMTMIVRRWILTRRMI